MRGQDIPTGAVRLIYKQQVADGTFLFRFQVQTPPLDVWSFVPGQFINLGFVDTEDTLHWRSYSIASHPDQYSTDTFDLLIRTGDTGFGIGTKALLATEYDDVLPFRGAYGLFTLPKELPEEIVFIATGTGIAPVRSMLMELQQRRHWTGNIVLIYGGRTPADIAYLDELMTLNTLQKTFCFSRTKDFDRYTPHSIHGRVTDALPALNMATQYYICGNGAMCKDVQTHYKNEGISRKQIHTELFF